MQKENGSSAVDTEGTANGASAHQPSDQQESVADTH